MTHFDWLLLGVTVLAGALYGVWQLGRIDCDTWAGEAG